MTIALESAIKMIVLKVLDEMKAGDDTEWVETNEGERGLG